MKTAAIFVILCMISVAKAWTGDPAPAPESYKAAIDLVQTNGVAYGPWWYCLSGF